jgi:hypothetical protein
MSARNWMAIRTALTLIVVAGLAVDAYVHFDLASAYSGVKTSSLNQGELFRLEGALAVIAAVALLIRPRRYTAAFAFLVSAGGTAAVVVYRYVNVGGFGPVPNMYDPIWYGEKTLSVVAEAIAAVAALLLFVALDRRARRSISTATPRAAARVQGTD